MAAAGPGAVLTPSAAVTRGGVTITPIALSVPHSTLAGTSFQSLGSACPSLACSSSHRNSHAQHVSLDLVSGSGTAPWTSSALQILVFSQCCSSRIFSALQLIVWLGLH